MDKKLKTKWLKALRSGRYKQTRGTLYDGEGYCCLGVLCRVAKLRARRSPYDSVNFYYRGDGDNHYLPGSFGKEVGLLQASQKMLGRKNDNSGWSFKQIADYIEKHY